MTISPPARYKPTFKGDNFSAAHPIDLMPPMMTSHVSMAIVIPDASFGMPTTPCHAGDIAGPDRSGKRRHECLERRSARLPLGHVGRAGAGVGPLLRRFEVPERFELEGGLE